jgi:alkylation response protein AidB-like acyl-CoA dehydrogenase
MFRLSMPRAMGGPELTPMAQVQVVEALSMFDASIGWTAMLGLHAGYFIAFLDSAAARSMYADLDRFTDAVSPRHQLLLRTDAGGFDVGSLFLRNLPGTYSF